MSTTNLFLGLASLSAGAYHGFCDAQGIPFEKESIETALIYGPAVVRGTYTGLAGLIKGGVAGASEDAALGGAIVGTLGGAAIGAGIGGIQTLVGYAMGYLAGYTTR